MSGGVFISYRREDASGFARAICDRLAQRLDRKNVFFDVDNIEPGVDFVDVLTERVGACDALVAVIGKRWISSSDENNRRRLDDPNDLMRIEIEAALTRGVRVIPVLVDGARMPKREDLPESLTKLARRNGIAISHDRFDADVERLTNTLYPIVGERRQRETAEPERAGLEEREKREYTEKAERERLRAETEAAEAAKAGLAAAAKSASDAAHIAAEPTRGEPPATQALRRTSANQLLLAAVASVATLGAAMLIANQGRQVNTRVAESNSSTAAESAREAVTPAPPVTPTLNAVAQPESAAALSTPREQYNQGEYYYRIDDYQQAMDWYRKAADQGDADAQDSIGSLYRDGKGVGQDYAEAMAWFRKAALQSNSEAQVNIGSLYRDGHGVKQDYAQARRWYQKAADQRNILGIMFLNQLEGK
jgi:tetratricopeptide (TPR) repeat protein